MRHHRRNTIRALALLTAAAAAPLSAHAFSLQDCNPSLTAAGNPNARLPVGQLGDDGFGYRDALRQFIANTQLTDVAYPANWYPATTPFSNNTPYWQAGAILYGAYTYVFGQGTLDGNGDPPNPNIYPTQCLADLGNPGLQASEKQVLEQEFLLEQNGTELVPDLWKYFMLEPSNYLIGNIEDRDACVARLPNLRHSANLTFMAQFEYPGNLFLGVQAQSQRRFAVYLALLLIQSDWAGWNGLQAQPSNNQPRPNPYPPAGPGVNGELFLQPGAIGANSYRTWLPSGAISASDGGARLVMMGRIHQWLTQTQPAWLTPSLKAAFEEGLARAGERISRLNLTGGHANRYFQSVHGLAAIKQALVGTQYHTDAANWHDDALADFIAIFRPAGYFGDDDGRYDAAYNRYNIRHVIRALMTDPGTPAQNVATLTAMAQKLGELEAHMILTDRTGIHTSPSAMSVRTGGGVAGRGLTVASSPESAIGYLAAHDFGVPFAYARVRDLDGIGPFDHSTTLAQVDARSSNPDFWGELICRNHPNHDPFAWKPQLQPWPTANQTEANISGAFWGYTRPHHEIEGYDTSTSAGSPLRAFADALDQTPAAGFLPIETAGPHLRNFDDEFVFAKFGGSGVYFEGSPLGNSTHNSYQADSPRDYAAIFHLGRVSTRHNPCAGQTVPRGFGGGQVAGLWAPGGGIFSMSRRRGYNNACDSWLNGAWRALPMHAVTLVDTADRVSTSARIAVPVVDTHFAAQPSSPSLPMDYINQGPAALTGVANVAPGAADAAFLQAEGDFSDQRYDTATGALVNVATPIHFRRRFVPYADGMYVRTELIAQTTTIMPTHRVAPQRGSQGQVVYPVPMPEVVEAWETLPINLTQGPTITGFVNTEITLKDSFGAEIGVPAPGPGAASTAWSDVTTVIVTREEGRMVIRFDSPQTVAFSEDFETFGGDTPSQNLLVDLTPSRVSSANINAASPTPDQLVPTVLTYKIDFE